MANRTRPNQVLFFVSDDEKRIIKAKMAQLGTKNMGAYLRKMAIDGYIIKVDYTQQKKLAAAVSRVASNINQICRRINSTGHFYADDIAELKERQGEIWQLLKSSQSEELYAKFSPIFSTRRRPTMPSMFRPENCLITRFPLCYNDFGFLWALLSMAIQKQCPEHNFYAASCKGAAFCLKY